MLFSYDRLLVIVVKLGQWVLKQGPHMTVTSDFLQFLYWFCLCETNTGNVRNHNLMTAGMLQELDLWGPPHKHHLHKYHYAVVTLNTQWIVITQGLPLYKGSYSQNEFIWMIMIHLLNDKVCQHRKYFVLFLKLEQTLTKASAICSIWFLMDLHEF